MPWSSDAVFRHFSADRYILPVTSIRRDTMGFQCNRQSGLTVEQLASECRNNVVGYMTVGEIRTMGYEVRETSGEGRHATVVVPRPWEPAIAEKLAMLFRPAKNPSPKRRR